MIGEVKKQIPSINSNLLKVKLSHNINVEGNDVENVPNFNKWFQLAEESNEIIKALQQQEKNFKMLSR